MQIDPASIAFLHSLQRDLLGPDLQSQAELETELAPAVPSPAAEGERRAAADVTGTAEPTPTPYEPAIGYSILTELTDDIVTALRKNLELNPLLVGTLPMGWPMAILLRVPDSASHIALVDREFTIFANLLAKACAQALLPTSGDESVEAWEAGLQSGSHAAVQRYVELMFATMTTSPVGAPAYLPAPELSGILDQIRTAIEVFVVSEPFVHLALGHQHDATPLALPALHVLAESYKWTDEQRKRSFMMRLSVVASVFEKRGYPDKSLGYWSIEMFLFTRELLETAKSSERVNPKRGDSRAEHEMTWLRTFLGRSEGRHSRSLGLLDRLSPVPRAFAAQFKLILSKSEPGVH